MPFIHGNGPVITRSNKLLNQRPFDGSNVYPVNDVIPDFCRTTITSIHGYDRTEG